MIRSNTSKGLFTGMIMLDLQKAFDTVNHDILCEKLKAMGVMSTEWFLSYLANRKQVVSINNMFRFYVHLMWCAAGQHIGTDIIFMLCE